MNQVAPLKLALRLSEDATYLDLWLGKGRFNEATYTTGFSAETAGDEKYLVCYAEL